MKKCKDCDKEIDKYAIACQYCGRMQKKQNHIKSTDDENPIEPDDQAGKKHSS